MLSRKLQSPEEPAPPPQQQPPPTRCTESFDGLRPRVGGADLGWVPAALRPWVAPGCSRPETPPRNPNGLAHSAQSSMLSGSRDFSFNPAAPSRNRFSHVLIS